MIETAPEMEARLALLERKLRRAEAARQEAEALLERRSRELDRSNRELRQRESVLAARLDRGNRNLLQAQKIGRIATFYRAVGEPFIASETLNEIMGFPPGLAASISDVVAALHPLDSPRITRLEAAFYDGTMQGDGYVFDCRIIRSDGAMRWLRCTQQRQVDDSGNRTAISGTVQDITEQRATQRRAQALQLIGERNLIRLRQTENALAARVIELERTAAALRASHDRTEDAFRAKSRFLASMSHNIRTPMNGVLGMMTALAQSALDPAQQRQLALARQAGDELRALIDNIIDIADSGAQDAADTATMKSAANAATPLPDPENTAALEIAGRRPRILVAEDIETNQIVLCSMLDTLGCDHVVVGNGLLALEAVRESDFDAILMDVQMPVMDGAEATRQIRRLPLASASTPIIGITAQAIQAERDLLVAAGMSACLAKPIMVPALATALREAMSPSTAPMIDAAVFARAMSMMPVPRRRALFDQMSSDLTQLAADFAVAGAAHDNEGVRRARHSLDGVASNFGAVAVTAVLDTTRDGILPATAADKLSAIISATIAEGRQLLRRPAEIDQ